MCLLSSRFSFCYLRFCLIVPFLSSVYAVNVQKLYDFNQINAQYADSLLKNLWRSKLEVLSHNGEFAGIIAAALCYVIVHNPVTTSILKCIVLLMVVNL